MSSSVKKITLKSSDGVSFEVDEAVAKRMMIGDDCIADNVIPLPNVRSDILAKIIEYCKKHANDSTADEELGAWDAEFVRLDPSTLCGLIKAAQHLNIKELMYLTAKAIAALISRGKTPEQIRKTFNIKNDFTPEEEEEEEWLKEEEKLRHAEWRVRMKESGVLDIDDGV